MPFCVPAGILTLAFPPSIVGTCIVAPRVASAIDIGNLKNKFLKLRAFYTRANAKKKLIEFKQINLQFDNQVVGVKNNSYVKK